MEDYELPGDKRKTPIQVLGHGTNQQISMTGSTDNLANDFDAKTTVIRVAATADCFIKLGVTAVEAALTDIFFPAGLVEYIKLNEGEVNIAAIMSADTGTLTVTEMK